MLKRDPKNYLLNYLKCKQRKHYWVVLQTAVYFYLNHPKLLQNYPTRYKIQFKIYM